MNKNNEYKVPVLSFYSGGGFMDMGFEKAGFEIVWTNEFDKVFAYLHSEGITSWRKSYGNNIKAEIFNTKSITEIASREIIQEAFPNGRPKFFGIIGGPPCQDFSMNGSMQGFNGERGKLTSVFFEKIMDLKPSFFVMENVPGLIRKKDFLEHLNKLMLPLKEEYYIEFETLNSLNYGVPQSRERVFFVGFRKNLIKKRKQSGMFSFPINNNYNNSKKKYKWPIIDNFGSTPSPPENVPLELTVSSCLVDIKNYESTPNAKEYFNLKKSEIDLNSINEGETNRPSFKRLHRYRYSPTTCYGNNEVHLHPFFNRRISVREALRIQGVDDSYVLPSGYNILSKKFKMIGNGVPVPLAKAVALQVKLFLENNM